MIFLFVNPQLLCLFVYPSYCMFLPLYIFLSLSLIPSSPFIISFLLPSLPLYLSFPLSPSPPSLSLPLSPSLSLDSFYGVLCPKLEDVSKDDSQWSNLSHALLSSVPDHQMEAVLDGLMHHTTPYVIAHSMHSTCTQYAQHMHTVCTAHAHSMHSTCRLSSYYKACTVQVTYPTDCIV